MQSGLLSLLILRVHFLHGLYGGGVSRDLAPKWLLFLNLCGKRFLTACSFYLFMWGVICHCLHSFLLSPPHITWGVWGVVLTPAYFFYPLLTSCGACGEWFVTACVLFLSPPHITWGVWGVVLTACVVFTFLHNLGYVL